VQEQVATAMFNKGITLGQMNRPEEAIVVYDALISQFQSSEHPPVQEQVAKAMVNKGVSLGIANKKQEAIQMCNKVIERFGGSSEPQITEIIQNAKRLKELIEKNS
jgi:outer membrane protein assembly factor BamD (BamD/ComL family)